MQPAPRASCVPTRGTTLVAAAQAAGEAEIRACCCERIQQQARDIAEWLLRYLPDLTTAFLDRSAVNRIDVRR